LETMLPIKRYRIFILALLGLIGCIEKYYPKEIYENESNLVISGRVTTSGDYHLVKVSKTSSLQVPKYNPVTACNVVIEDSDGNTFVSDFSTNKGEYYVRIAPEFLVVGKAFKLKVVTPQGFAIESTFDTLKPCPEVSDMYFQRFDKPTSNPQIFERGAQFMIDIEADESYDRFFCWELEETYEYLSAFPLEYYYDGEVHAIPPDYHMYHCWQTLPIKDFFPLSTKNLSENRFVGYNLHFVNNRSQKLMHLYSVMLHQYSISEAYHFYLEQLKNNSNNQEGLFGTQPLNVKGNLVSTSNPESNVLGFFSAEGVKSRRFFFSFVMDVPFEIPESCVPYVPLNGFSSFHPDDYPIYLAMGEDGVVGYVMQSCIDCRLLGGTTEKPDFWPY